MRQPAEPLGASGDQPAWVPSAAALPGHPAPSLLFGHAARQSSFRLRQLSSIARGPMARPSALSHFRGAAIHATSCAMFLSPASPF
eukprot:8839122-Pyramimonas_sp.AAC.1